MANDQNYPLNLIRLKTTYRYSKVKKPKIRVASYIVYAILGLEGVLTILMGLKSPAEVDYRYGFLGLLGAFLGVLYNKWSRNRVTRRAAAYKTYIDAEYEKFTSRK